MEKQTSTATLSTVTLQFNGLASNVKQGTTLEVRWNQVGNIDITGSGGSQPNQVRNAQVVMGSTIEIEFYISVTRDDTWVYIDISGQNATIANLKEGDVYIHRVTANSDNIHIGFTVTG